MTWFVLIDVEEKGPFESQALKDLLQQGQIRPEDHVWKEGMAEWIPISHVPEFMATASDSAAIPVLPPVPPVPPTGSATPGVAPSSGTPGVAVASFVLGLLTFIANLVAGLPAIICGHIALGKFSKTPGLQGKWMAITGLVLGYVSVLSSVFLIAIAVPAMSKARANAYRYSCINNLRMIEGAMQMHALEYNLTASDRVTDQQWEAIQELLMGGELTCLTNDAPYQKPETYGMRPVCPNVAEYPDHQIP